MIYIKKIGNIKIDRDINFICGKNGCGKTRFINNIQQILMDKQIDYKDKNRYYISSYSSGSIYFDKIIASKFGIKHYCDGAKSLSSTLSLSLRGDPCIVFLDCPETYLHIDLHTYLIDYLLKNTTNQYFIITHSPEIISGRTDKLIPISKSKKIICGED